jgi:cobyrinic acid a,c-diamide synthase
MVTRQPRLVIAGTRSGDGKTTVATGLMAALRAAGMTVSGHKVGPDYIDPGYHAAATGRPGRNLDPWLVGEDRIAPLFLHGASGAGISVIEGVMGLFDGAANRGDFASTAHVARLLGAPIVLVVTASGAGRSIAATVHGFASYDPALRIAGVVLNQVSSPRHEQILRQAVAGTGIPVLGALPSEAVLHTPSRHLGLVPAAERGTDVADWLPALTAIIRDQLDLDMVTAIARGAPPLAAEHWSPGPARSGGGREPPGPAGRAQARQAGRNPRRPALIAVAAGPAFTFGYAEHAEMLAAAGADVTEFDPVTARELPAGTDALVAGGGFPELYAEALAGNLTLRADVAARVAAGLPVIAECAGLLWLGATLDGQPQCGALPATAAMTPKLTLGYREAMALTSSPLAAAGTTVRAHEFHRTASEPGHGTNPAWELPDGSRQGWATPALVASYLHVHWAGVPDAASRLVAAALRSRHSASAAPSAGSGRGAAGR